MGQLCELLHSVGEPFAAGFMEFPDKSPFYRFSRAIQCYFQKMNLMPYKGGKLYPCGGRFAQRFAVFHDHAYTYAIDRDYLATKIGEEDATAIREALGPFPVPFTEHFVGGGCYVHSFPNYERIEREGLNRYRERILALEPSEFRDGLLLVLEGIDGFRIRCLELLRKENAPECLIHALEKVPFQPAETLYEAIVCRNFIFYIDAADNPGRLDAELIRFYQGEDAVDLFSEFFDNVDDNQGWSVALGPDYNALTYQIIKAIKGKRRPLVELRVTPDMPDDLWELAADALKAGGGSPALYNEPLYQSVLAENFPHIPKEDLLRFNGGGCTETMLAGISRVGSLDAGINTALVFYNVMREKLTAVNSFEEFFDLVIAEIDSVTATTLGYVHQIYEHRINHVPHPVRTLLIDDCIDNQTDFNAGGARYNWSIINFAGMINVIDSLLAIRELIFDKKEYTPQQFLALLEEEEPMFFQRLKQCECFGNDDDHADSLAVLFVEKVFATLDRHKPCFGDKYLASSIQHTTYDWAGTFVPATPDGRTAGSPLCDSVGPLLGKAKNGPTALLKSVTKLPLSKAAGTPILNLRLQKNSMERGFKPLMQSFFERGGMQIQITCVSKEDMQDALVHPERHEDLIIRIGGHSEYFNRLRPALKKTVMERDAY